MVADPVGAGFVASVARPSGNLTGFMVWEPSMPGKWLELLTEIAPAVRRVAITFNPDTACMGLSLSRVHHAIFVVLRCLYGPFFVKGASRHFCRASLLVWAFLCQGCITPFLSCFVACMG